MAKCRQARRDRARWRCRQPQVAGRRLPEAIGYEVTDEKLFVLAVFHQHRKPEYWTDRTSA